MSLNVMTPPTTVFFILYVQEVVTLQKNILIYLHQKIRLKEFFNSNDILG